MGAPAVAVVNHPVFGQGTVRVVDLGWAPEGQVAGMVALMQQRVREDAQDPWFKSHAEKVLTPAPTDSPSGIAKRAWAHVRSHMRFVQDRDLAKGLEGVIPAAQLAETIEWSMRPRDTAVYVERGIAAGDCDCFQEYLAGLLAVAGIDCAFVTVAANPEAPELESHVYVRAYPSDMKGEALALDPSHGEWAGWEVPNQFGKLTEWPVGACGSGSGPGLIAIVAMAASVALLVDFGIKQWGRA